MAPNTIPEIPVQPQSLGEVFLASRTLVGPASYNNTGVAATSGALLSATFFGLLSSIKFLEPEDTSANGLNFVRAFRIGNGVSANTVRVRWFVLATGVEVANAVNLSADSIRLLAIGN